MSKAFSAISLAFLMCAIWLLSSSRPVEAYKPPQSALTPTAISTQRIMKNKDWKPVVTKFDDVEMVLVPSGCFIMGTDEGDYWGFDKAHPAHQVCFEQPFWIDRYEVTNIQVWASGLVSYGVGHWAYEDQPYAPVYWYDARDFCLWRGARLPSEAEWEYAARGPESWRYPWGNDYDHVTIDKPYNRDESPPGAAPVGSWLDDTSWVGASDMASNLKEWVNSVFAPYPYRADDGRETSDLNAGGRVIRGGTYYDQQSLTRRLERRSGGDDPIKFQDYIVGFRCALSFQPTLRGNSFSARGSVHPLTLFHTP